MAFSVGQVQFLDSMQFMNQSLDGLVKTLAPDEFIYMGMEYTDPAHLQLLQQKGVYCYDYIDDFDRFEETSLPDKEDFYNKLNDKELSSKEYRHAQNVWDAFGCTNLGDYHDTYLKSDILLLADVFEKFRNVCLHHYGLDPCHYYTSPGLAWDAVLKMTGIELELITDIDQYKFIESAIRGGISMITTRYAAANNSYCPRTFNPFKPMTHIIYLDTGNLYGHAMCQYLPTGGFLILSESAASTRFPLDTITKVLPSLPDDGSKGYGFEVDIDYPDYLHDGHNDYPLAPELLEITREMCSPLQEAAFPKEPAQKKLTPN